MIESNQQTLIYSHLVKTKHSIALSVLIVIFFIIHSITEPYLLFRTSIIDSISRNSQLFCFVKLALVDVSSFRYEVLLCTL